MEVTDLLDYQFSEVLARRELLNLLPRDDDHLNPEGGQFDVHDEVRSREVRRLARYSICRDQYAKTHSAVSDFHEKPGNLFTVDGILPSLTFDEKEIAQISTDKAGRVVFIFARNVDLLRHERVHLVSRGDLDTGDAVQEVAGQFLESLAFRGVGRRVVDNGKISLDDRRVVCGHRS